MRRWTASGGQWVLEGSGLELAGNAAPDWPKTLAEAVDRVAAGLSPALVRALRRTQCADLVQFHLGWGTWLRNHFGLWAGNDALLKDCGASHPDECSMTIIEGVWDLVNVVQPPPCSADPSPCP